VVGSCNLLLKFRDRQITLDRWFLYLAGEFFVGNRFPSSAETLLVHGSRLTPNFFPAPARSTMKIMKAHFWKSLPASHSLSHSSLQVPIDRRIKKQRTFLG
jgi:hypothetical protein